MQPCNHKHTKLEDDGLACVSDGLLDDAAADDARRAISSAWLRADGIHDPTFLATRPGMPAEISGRITIRPSQLERA